MRPYRVIVLGLMLVGFGRPAPADQPPAPTITVSAGQFLVRDNHDNIVQTELRLPLWAHGPWGVRYQYREITPFWKDNSQAQLLYTRNQFEASLTLNQQLAVSLLGGYWRNAAQDRPGAVGAGVVALGLGTLPAAEPAPLAWQIQLGSFFARDELAANWWLDGRLDWQIHQFAQQHYLETQYQPNLGLAASLETVNEDASIRSLYRVGPYLEFVTAHGNRARISAGWYFADGNPFYEDRESGLLVSLQVQSAPDKPHLFQAREHRRRGWLPVVWGEYDLGWGGDRTLQRSVLEAEVQDYMIAQRQITGKVWYESRQEYRRGDFDNISYSVSAGLQTVVGWASVLSQDQPLVLGADYLHRSGHALAPDPDRVPAGTFLARNNINVGPRLRLQTLGWDLPYRDPASNTDKFRWLHRLDWRLSVGYDFFSSRARRQPAAQAGLNWDIAATGGCVLYGRAIGSVGNETPDWLFEGGLRRQTGKLFFRAERYGLESRLANGQLYAAGIGFYL